MTRYIIAIVLILLTSYGLYEAWPLLRGPGLSISSPTEGGVFPGSIVTISGNVVRTTGLTLDGAPLYFDKTGNFSSTLAFPRGTSILTFRAADRFGRAITQSRTIFVPMATSTKATSTSQFTASTSTATTTKK